MSVTDLRKPGNGIERGMNQKIAVGVVFVLALFMNIMDVTIVNVALPSLGRDLHAAPTAVSAVSIGYLVSLAVVIPVSGWLGDRFGSKRVLMTAIVLFTAGVRAVRRGADLRATGRASACCRASAAAC